MKKILALLLAFAMVFALCACGAVELPVSEPEPTPEYEMPKIVISGSEGSEEPAEPEAPAVSEPVEQVHSSVALSDDIFDFTFTIDGVNYQLPCPVSVFYENGWAFDEEDSVQTLGGERDSIYSLRKDGIYLMITAYNGSGDRRVLTDCSVGGIVVQPDEMYAKVYFGDGTLANTLTEKDVLNKYGEPTKVYDDYSRYDMAGEENTQYIFWYDNNRKIESIHIKNLKFIPGYDDTAVNPNPPTFYNEYAAPTAISDDIYSGTVKIDGDLYTLPIPVSVLMENGWEFDEISAETLAADSTLYSTTTFIRNGKKLHVELKNFSDRLAYVEDCCVYSVLISNEKLGAEIPGGIHVGMSEKDLVNAMPEGYDTGSNTYYLFDYDRAMDLWVQVEGGKVSAVHYDLGAWDH